MRPLLSLLLLMLGGCAEYQLVESGPQSVGAFAVTPVQIWNKVPPHAAPGRLPTWTVDGVALNSLSFISDIEDGEPLVAGERDAKYPIFHAGMLPNEIVEVVQSTCAKMFQATISGTGALKPMTIAGEPGFEVTFEFVTPDEVIRRAFVGGTVKDEQLNLVIFQAARMHYYDKDIANARNLITTATLP